MDYRPCEREQLPLTGGEIVAAFAHGFIQPAFKLVDKVIRVYVTAGLHDLLVGNSLFAQQNIAAYRAREKENVLKHLSEMPAQRCSLYLSDIDSVNQDFALLELVVAADKRKNRCFARAGRTDERNRVLRIDFERNALEYPFAGYITEPNVAEFNLAANLVKLNRIRCIRKLRFNVHNCEHLFGGSKCGLKPVELLRKVLNGVEESGNVHVERNDRACRQRLPEECRSVQIALAAKVEKAHHGCYVKHIDKGSEYAEHKYLLLFRPAQKVALFVELTFLRLLAVKNLSDFDAGKIFGKIGVYIGRSVFNLSVCSARELAEDNGEKHYERRNAQHHQRQFIVQEKHCNKDARQHEKVLHKIHKQRREHQ